MANNRSLEIRRALLRRPWRISGTGRRRPGSWAHVLGTVLVTFCLTGCITDATVELTKAPFDATTDLTHGTTDAIGEFTEPTKELLSSTTPGAWFTAAGTVKPEHRVRAFVVFNFHNLQLESARGDGESLRALATLSGLPRHRHADFFRFAQARYPALFAPRHSAEASVQRLLDTLASFSSSPCGAGSDCGVLRRKNVYAVTHGSYTGPDHGRDRDRPVASPDAPQS